MKRITCRMTDQNGDVTDLVVYDPQFAIGHAPETGIVGIFPESKREGMALRRLAAYEDTGLEPEEIQEAVGLFDGHTDDMPQEIKKWAERGAWHVRKCDELHEKLRLYEQTEAEGRLLVLPCKVGDAVWTLSPEGNVVQGIVESFHKNLVAGVPGAWVATAYYRLYHEGLYEVHPDFVPMRKYHHIAAFGKTVFLTREEAEIALKECDRDE